MITPHKCFLTTYLLIAPFVEQIVDLRGKKNKFQLHNFSLSVQKTLNKFNDPERSKWI
jgi:hypothetical protein